MFLFLYLSWGLLSTQSTWFCELLVTLLNFLTAEGHAPTRTRFLAKTGLPTYETVIVPELLNRQRRYGLECKAFNEKIKIWSTHHPKPGNTKSFPHRKYHPEPRNPVQHSKENTNNLHLSTSIKTPKCKIVQHVRNFPAELSSFPHIWWVP